MLLQQLANAVTTASTSGASQPAPSIFDLPTTTWGMLGTLAAALVAATVSLVNLMSNKEQHVAEFTRHWIEELMADLAKFLGNMELILKLHQVAEIKNPPDMSREELLKLRTENKDNYEELNESYYRLLLRLDHDSSEHQPIIQNLHEVLDAFFGPCGNIQIIDARRASLVEKTRALSRTVWKSIKDGDDAYKRLKFALYGVIAISLIGLAAICFAVLHAHSVA